MAKKSLLDRISPSRHGARLNAELARDSHVWSAVLDDSIARLRAAFPDRGDRLALELEQYAWHAWEARRKEITDGFHGDKQLFARGCSVCPRSAETVARAAVFTTFIGTVEGLNVDPDYIDTSVALWTAERWIASENERGLRVCERCIDASVSLAAAARATYDPRGARSFPRTGPDPALADSLRADLSRALAESPHREMAVAWIAPVAEPTSRRGCSNHHQGDARGMARIGVESWLCARCIASAASARLEHPES